MLSLIWNVEELKQLNQAGRHRCTDMLEALDLVHAQKVSQKEHKHSLPQKLTSICTCLCDVVKGLFHFKRTPATHMFVFMISSQLHNKKSYAIPLQCLPYASLTKSDVWNLVTCLVKEMVGLGMSVADEGLNELFCITVPCIFSVYRFCMQWGVELPKEQGVYTPPFHPSNQNK